MLIAHYIGDHGGDGWLSRIGVALVRFAQKGPYGHVTHAEAIHAVHEDGSVTMASASLMDGGVRSKRLTLNPAHWLITDVPQWDVRDSIDFFAESKGWPYDWRGALATVMPGSQDGDAAFCNEWVAAPYLKASGTFGPHHFCAICMSIGVDVTEQFFFERVNKP